jgi:hypothetical protein
MTTSTDLFPPDNTYRSVSYAARFFGRAERTIRYWAQFGVFATLNIPIFKDRKGRLWIRIPSD